MQYVQGQVYKSKQNTATEAIYLGEAKIETGVVRCWHRIPPDCDQKEAQHQYDLYHPLTFATMSDEFSVPTKVQVRVRDLSSVACLVRSPYDTKPVRTFSWV